MKRLIIWNFCLMLMWAMAGEVMACTSAVVSGKVTPDGRPLLWKHRDTGALQNSVKYFSGEKYSFIAVVNSGEDNPTDVWIGTNSVGFSVMNTQSYNLVEVKDDEERGEANFGVIDAQGGAAMFEVDYEKYVMFDANDPKDAPCGYIARSNFSFTGKVNVGAGYVRYMQEDKLLMPASAMKRITPAWIFSELSRSFANPILGIDLKQGDFNLPKGTGWFVEQDFISRHESASSVVIQGVKRGENPDLVTMWTALGYPPVSVALPLWVKGADRKLPALVRTEKDTAASGMSRRTTVLLDKVYAYNQGMGTNRYFNWELLYNLDKTGYMQLLAPVESKVFQVTEPLMEEWRTKGTPDVQQMYQFYDELDRYVAGEYNRLFGL